MYNIDTVEAYILITTTAGSPPAGSLPSQYPSSLPQLATNSDFQPHQFVLPEVYNFGENLLYKYEWPVITEMG